MSNQPYISIKNVSKTFSVKRWPWSHATKVKALDHLSLDIAKGQCVAILGDNGAGKTTLLKILATTILPDLGMTTIDGFQTDKDDTAIKSLMTTVSHDDRAFYWRLTGRQNLAFYAALHGLPSAIIQERLTHMFHQWHMDYADQRFDRYSTGMKRKCALIRALLPDPEILLLDEPTKSLDLTSTGEFHAIVQTKIHHGTTVILATHDMAEAETLAETFVLLHQGRIQAAGSLIDIQTAAGIPSGSLKEIYTRICHDPI